jgi:hypothetical protein
MDSRPYFSLTNSNSFLCSPIDLASLPQVCEALGIKRDPVCEVAAEFIADYDLQTRIRAHAGDMWTDPFPPADVHFYSMIYHDWTPEKCRFLTGTSFESLRSRGHILIHEMLYNDEKKGPFPIAAFSIIMLGWTEGEQYSGKEISKMLREAGFGNIQVRPTFGLLGHRNGSEAFNRCDA